MPVFAGTGVNFGAIENTFVTSSTSFSQSPGNFLITIAGLDTLCPNHGFAYTLETDPDYVDFENTINNARGDGERVYVYWETDAQGYCHITNVTIG